MHNHCIPFQRKCYNKKREWINTCFSVPVDFLCVSLKTKIIKPVKRNSYPLKFSILALLKKNRNLKLQTKMNISAVLKLSFWFFLKYNTLKSCTYFGLWKRDYIKISNKNSIPVNKYLKKYHCYIFLNQGSRNITLPRLLF